jgi:hypothetical protein
LNQLTFKATAATAMSGADDSGAAAAPKAAKPEKRKDRIARELARGNRPVQNKDRVAGAARAVPVYDPFDPDQVAPLEVSDFYSDQRSDGQPLTFRFDEEQPVRQVLRRDIHGRAETAFEDENVMPEMPKAYRERVMTRDTPDDSRADAAIDEERRAAEFDQPEHVLAQFRTDVANPAFLQMRAEKGRITAPPPGTIVATEAPMAPIELASTSTHQPLSNKVSDGAIGAPTLSVADAKRLLAVDPLEFLQRKSRADFLRMPDVAACFRTLYSIVMSHEEHRRHYNLAELVHTLAGSAKYNSSTSYWCEAPLGALLDQDFYASYLLYNDHAVGATGATSGPRLAGGHEHFTANAAGSEGTALCVLEFFLVFNNRANGDLLGEIVRARNNTKAQAKAAADAAAAAAPPQLRINRAGLFDIDSVDVADPLAASFPFGSMHDAKILENAFLITLRVVCVECDDSAGAGARATESVPAAPPAESLSHAQGGPATSDEYLPDARLVLTHTQCTKIVGVPRATAFQQLIESPQLRLLCVRSFSFGVAIPS